MSFAWAYAALGGAIGSLARYGVALALKVQTPSFPFATLIVNVVGSAAIGFLAAVLPAEALTLRVFLLAGVLGGFTTMSSFSLEIVLLCSQGRLGAAAVYLAASLVSCIGGCALGHALGLGVRA